MPISQSQRGRERMNRENIHSASQYPETQQQQQPPSIPPKHKRRDSSGSQHNFNFSAEAHSRRGDSAEQQQQAIPRSPPPNYSNGPASPPPRPPKEPTNSTSTSGSYAVKVRGSQSSGLSSTAASRGSQGTFGTRNSQSSSVNRNTDGMMAELPGDLVGLGLTMQSPETNREGTRSKSKQRASGSSGPSSRRKSLTDSGMPRRPVKRKLRVLSLGTFGSPSPLAWVKMPVMKHIIDIEPELTRS